MVWNCFLTTWTMLLIGYSWYMMRSGKNFKHVQVPLFPETLNAFAEPQVTHEYTSVEGLVTWTLARVRGRLKRATETGNIGAGMKYQQMQRWLEACLLHLPDASLENRQETLDSLNDAYELSEDDNSPSYNLGKVERDFLANSHEEVHRCLVKLLELQKVETTTELLGIFGEIFRTPVHPDSDESMHEETQSERLTRYRNSEQCEVSDPDEWAVIHYGTGAHETEDNDSTDGVEEF